MLRSVNDQKRSTWLWIAGIGWVGVILAAGVLPLNNFVGHSHWNAIVWFPSFDSLNSPRILARILLDVVANILLFAPLGWILAQRFSRKGQQPSLFVIAVALILSLGIELYQVYCHDRVPSLLDLIANTCGTYWGAQFAVYNGYMRSGCDPNGIGLPGPASTNKRPHA